MEVGLHATSKEENPFRKRIAKRKRRWPKITIKSGNGITNFDALSVYSFTVPSYELCTYVPAASPALQTASLAYVNSCFAV
jgi:hypothetical protein